MSCFVPVCVICSVASTHVGHFEYFFVFMISSGQAKLVDIKPSLWQTVLTWHFTRYEVNTLYFILIPYFLLSLSLLIFCFSPSLNFNPDLHSAFYPQSVVCFYTDQILIITVYGGVLIKTIYPLFLEKANVSGQSEVNVRFQHDNLVKKHKVPLNSHHGDGSMSASDHLNCNPADQDDIDLRRVYGLESFDERSRGQIDNSP